MSVLGSLTLLLFVGEMLGLHWRGLIGDLVGVWANTVRPLTKILFEYTIVAVFRSLHWHIFIPQLARDYVSVGIILLFSVRRAGSNTWEMEDHGLPYFNYDIPLFVRRTFHIFMCIFVWPYFILAMIRTSLHFYRSGLRMRHYLKLLDSYEQWLQYKQSNDSAANRSLWERERQPHRTATSYEQIKNTNARALSFLVALSPIIYFLILFIANYCLLNTHS
jgi:hypothetical protein